MSKLHSHRPQRVFQSRNINYKTVQIGHFHSKEQIESSQVVVELISKASLLFTMGETARKACGILYDQCDEVGRIKPEMQLLYLIKCHWDKIIIKNAQINLILLNLALQYFGITIEDTQNLYRTGERFERFVPTELADRIEWHENNPNLILRPEALQIRIDQLNEKYSSFGIVVNIAKWRSQYLYLSADCDELCLSIVQASIDLLNLVQEFEQMRPTEAK
ncbi:MAG: hypothetical protein MHMPM18_003567 [Marteilia pararefringens]